MGTLIAHVIAAITLALSNLAGPASQQITSYDPQELYAQYQAEAYARWLAKARANEEARIATIVAAEVAAQEAARQAALAAEAAAAAQRTYAQSQAQAQAAVDSAPRVEPTVRASVRSRGGSGSLQKWLAASVWPSELWATVTRIIMCESGGNPSATNGHHEGLMQVDPDFWGHAPADPIAQLNQGYHVYLTQGWTAWQCY